MRPPAKPQIKPYPQGVIITPDRVAILEALLKIPTAKLQDIHSKTGLYSSSIRHALVNKKALMRAGLVEKTEYGSYLIVPSKREAVRKFVEAWHELFAGGAESERR